MHSSECQATILIGAKAETAFATKAWLGQKLKQLSPRKRIIWSQSVLSAPRTEPHQCRCLRCADRIGWQCFLHLVTSIIRLGHHFIRFRRRRLSHTDDFHDHLHSIHRLPDHCAVLRDSFNVLHEPKDSIEPFETTPNIIPVLVTWRHIVTVKNLTHINGEITMPFEYCRQLSPTSAASTPPSWQE